MSDRMTFLGALEFLRQWAATTNQANKYSVKEVVREGLVVFRVTSRQPDRFFQALITILQDHGYAVCQIGGDLIEATTTEELQQRLPK